MLNRAKLITILCTSLLASTAYSEDTKAKGVYVKASSGLVVYKKLKEKSAAGVYASKAGKNAPLVSLAIGYDFNKYVATEILGRFSRLRYRFSSSAETNSQNMNSYSLFWNVYLKYPISKLTPYVIIGPGISFNKSGGLKFISTSTRFKSGTNPGKNITSFAWNIGFGSEVCIAKNVSLDLGYRYISLGKIGVKAGNSAPQETRKVAAQDITLGVIYKF